MEHLIEDLTNGNVTEVKVVLATVVLALAGYQPLLGVLALKVAAVRLGGRLSRLLPLLGISVLILFGLTWLTSAGDFLGVDR